jgi:anaerobic selenocysteine-containing dehydrogenase
LSSVKPGEGTAYSVCPYNCWPVNCGIQIEHSSDKFQISGNPHHDFSRGKLCVKGQSCGEIADNPNRITEPMRRKRGSDNWEKITWSQALDEIASRMRSNIDADKPQANALYHSHGNIVQRVNWKILTPRFANMLNMTLWDGNFPCWYDVGLAQELSGYYGLHNPSEIGSDSAAVINWATDPCASMANMTPYLLQLKERGGQLVTIDPRVTQTAAISTMHIRPRLGSDVWLANAIASILIRENAVDEEFISAHTFGYEKYKEHLIKYNPRIAAAQCDLRMAEIERVAQVYVEAKPLCTNLSRGALGKHWNGVQMVRSILSLVALSGNIGKRGGGAVWGEAIDWNLELMAEASRRQDIDFAPNNFNAIDQALESGEIDTLLVVGGNPLSQWPNLNRLRKQLDKLPLIVVNDLFLNHTAKQVADIFLPATSWLEELGLRTSNSHIYLMDKVVAPVGEAKEASWWMNELAQRLGLEDYFPWQDKESCLDECLDSPACENATVEKLRLSPGGIKALIPELPYSDFQFSSVSGKFEFYSQKAAELGLPPLPEYEDAREGLEATPKVAAKFSLQLISARRNTHFHSFHDSHSVIPTLAALEPGPLLHIHPVDADQRNIADGELVEMFNDRGVSVVTAEVTTEVMRGHLSLNDCWPELNILTSSDCPVDPEVTRQLNLGGQPAYQNVLVEIRKVQK